MFNEMTDAGSSLPMMVERLVQAGWKTHNHHDNWVHSDIQGEYDTHEAYAVLHGKSIDKKENPLPTAMAFLKEALKEEDYRIGWIANIAMAFQDACDRYNDINRGSSSIDVPSEILHEVANTAAENFINLLCMDIQNK